MKICFNAIIIITLMLVSLIVSGGATIEPVIWRENFANLPIGKLPKNWKFEKHLGTPKTSFKIENQLNGRVLAIDAVKSSGAIVTVPKGVDLNKTPILRWRWRAISLPPNADGRTGGKDDQAIAIYVGMNSGIFGKKTLAYRWETETPRHISAKTSYGLGMIKVNWFCLRNKYDKLGTWYTEERNIANDFKKIYGFIPKKFALSIAANSQYTVSSTKAELQWLEFVPEVKNKKTATQLLVQVNNKTIKFTGVKNAF